jgi:hypothetical protein
MITSLLRKASPAALALLLAVTAACATNGAKADTTATSSSEILEAAPAPIVGSCVLTVAEVQKLAKLTSGAPVNDRPDQCSYAMTTASGASARLEIRVKTSITDDATIPSLRAAEPTRKVTELPGVGRSAIVFDADPALSEVPGFVMTNAGLATIKWIPGAQPGKSDTALAISFTKAVAEKLKVRPAAAKATDPGVTDQSVVEPTP